MIKFVSGLSKDDWIKIIVALIGFAATILAAIIALTDSNSGGAVVLVTPTPIEIAANTGTPKPISTVTLFPTSTNTATTVATHTNTPSPSHTQEPTAIQSSTLAVTSSERIAREYPCDGQIPFSTGGMLNQVKVMPAPGVLNAPPVRRGSTVSVLDRVTDFGLTWYQIRYSNDNEGWIPSTYVDVSTECPA